ncbi:GTP pyrophosphokinase family protein [Arthrobacter echini]|uniref:GTP pyrophosphokinase family protein n=1 Tax=Arthrobacter echini TaxID=1529066 RepID=A0A5D0XQI3_9MICC|nr:GTP pyrophosphokinase family protein [Arthrobacter echini]TYC98638.1 GTP pyrophosphokinase family protein [Arthrobacter echini]
MDQQNLGSSLDAIADAIRARLRDDGLNYHLIESRVKSVDSTREKLQKTDARGQAKYRNGIDDLDDILGVRIITYIQPDVANVVAALTGQFLVVENIDKKAQQMKEGVVGYAAHHLVLQVPSANTPPGCAACVGQRFEVQIKTVLQHAWAEFEHDVRYKALGEVSPAINRAFTLASGLIELADDEFVKIHSAAAVEKATNAADSHQGEPDLTADVLAELLAEVIPDHPRSRKDQYDWLLTLLDSMGINTVDSLRRLIEDVDWEEIDRRMSYRFPAGHVRVVDDMLLRTYGQEYITTTKDSGEDPGREAKLRHRLGKLTT